MSMYARSTWDGTDLSFITGIGMKNHYDVHACTFDALVRENIAVRMISDGADDLRCFTGMDQDRNKLGQSVDI